MRGDPWLYLSSLGFGSYLGEADAVTDELVRILGRRQCFHKANAEAQAVISVWASGAPL